MRLCSDCGKRMLRQGMPGQDVKTPRPQRKFLLGQGSAIFWRKRRIVGALSLQTHVHAILQADDALDFIGRSKTPLE